MKHPNKNKVAIDYDAAMVMMPMVLLGSSLGVLLNSMLPDAVIAILLTLLLLLTSIKCYFKGKKLYKKESESFPKVVEQETRDSLTREENNRRVNNSSAESSFPNMSAGAYKELHEPTSPPPMEKERLLDEVLDDKAIMLR